MPRDFESLTKEEKQLMIDAIPLITLLVAGADGEMDEKELDWAEDLTKIRSFDHNNKLNDFYEMIDQQFEARMRAYYSELSGDTNARLQQLSDHLAKLNPVLQKMDDLAAAIYYKNFRSFAKHIAEASGGIMRFLTVGPEEAAVIELPMLDVFE